MVPNGTFCEVSVSSSSQFPTLFPVGADFGDPPLMRVLALQSALTNASTAETFSVSFSLLSSFAFAWIVTRFSEDFLAVPDFQAVQFFIFTFHRFVTAVMKVAIFVTQGLPIII